MPDKNPALIQVDQTIKEKKKPTKKHKTTPPKKQTEKN